MPAAENDKARTTTSQKYEFRMPRQGTIHIEYDGFAHGYRLPCRIDWGLDMVVCAASRHMASSAVRQGGGRGGA